MSGTPTETEIQSMGTNLVDILEKIRVQADGWAIFGGEFDVLEQSLEGDYMPEVASATAALRAQCSDLVSAGQALNFIGPLLLEYGKYISDNAAGGTSGTGQGAVATDLPSLMSALYQHMVDTSLTVQSRTITHDTSASTSNGDGAAIVGNGAMTRLFTDHKAYEMEGCTIERKTFHCTQDQNTGAKEEAEVFSVEGEAPSFDWLGKNRADVAGQLGSGELGSIISLNAGSDRGGSLLHNSSFSDYTATNTPKFDSWTQTIAGTTASAGDITQSTGTAETNYYRDYPNSTTSAALKITGGGSGDDSYTFTQALAAMRITSINPNRPYFLRVMYKSDGTAVGTLKLRLGSTEESVTISGSTWKELFIAADENTWGSVFNEDGFGIDIEWESTAAGGVLLIDDVLFAPYTFIDGTYWVLRQNAASSLKPWLYGDTLEFTDTGGAPATGEINYWLYRTGLGYLPHTTGTPTWADPT